VIYTAQIPQIRKCDQQVIWVGLYISFSNPKISHLF